MNNNTSEYNNTYLSVNINNVMYGWEADNIIGIKESPDITEVVHQNKFIIGFTDYKGAILPVVDTQIKLGLPPIEISENTSIVVLEFYTQKNSQIIGAMVNSIDDIYQIKTDDIEEDYLMETYQEYKLTKGKVKIPSGELRILDIEKIFLTSGIFEMDEIELYNFKKVTYS